MDIVVVTADSRELVLRCLTRLNDAPATRVFVVDNASVDGTVQAIRTAFRDVAVVRLDQPASLGSAYNAGAAAGNSDLVLFLNDDVLAEPGAIDALREALEGSPAAVAAAGRLVDPNDGSTQAAYGPRPFPGLGTFAATLSGLYRVWPTNPWTGAHLHRGPLGERIELAETVAGACLLVRREVFEQVGCWDERFAFWFEDVELSRRLVTQGPIVYAPEARFEHVGGASAKRLTPSEVVVRYRTGALLYSRLHLDRRRQLGIGLLFASTSAVRMLTTRDRELAAGHRQVASQALALVGAAFRRDDAGRAARSGRATY